MKTETRQEPCQQVDACQNLGFLETVLIGQKKICQPSDVERCSTCGKGTWALARLGVLQLAQTFERIRFGRGGGDRTKSDVETPQVIDSSNGQNCANVQIRPSGVHAGYTDVRHLVTTSPIFSAAC